jgi:hypothetical protein
LRKPFLLGAAGMVVVIALAGLQQLEVDRRENRSEADLARALEDGGPCFGAAALDAPEKCDPVPYDKIVPAPVDAATDKSRAYADVSGGKDCFSYLPNFRLVRCSFGDQESETEIALVGNSHAGQWLPTLERLAEKNGWRITTYLASQCAAAETAQAFDTPARTEACLAWVDRTTRAVARSKPAAVLYTNRISVGAAGESFEDSGPLYREGMEEVLRAWDAEDLKVLVLRDTPAPDMSIPDCLAQHTDDVTACDGTREKWLPADESEDAARSIGSPRIKFVNLTDHICQEEKCSAVTGGVVTYFDGSHLTATFAATLDRYLGPPLRRLVTAGDD